VGGISNQRAAIAWRKTNRGGGGWGKKKTKTERAKKSGGKILCPSKPADVKGIGGVLEKKKKGGGNDAQKKGGRGGDQRNIDSSKRVTTERVVQAQALESEGAEKGEIPDPQRTENSRTNKCLRKKYSEEGMKDQACRKGNRLRRGPYSISPTKLSLGETQPRVMGHEKKVHRAPSGLEKKNRRRGPPPDNSTVPPMEGRELGADGARKNGLGKKNARSGRGMAQHGKKVE